MPESPEEQQARDRADKDAWREREGWCAPEEVSLILSGEDGVKFKLVDPVRD